MSSPLGILLSPAFAQKLSAFAQDLGKYLAEIEADPIG